MKLYMIEVRKEAPGLQPQREAYLFAEIELTGKDVHLSIDDISALDPTLSTRTYNTVNHSKGRDWILLQEEIAHSHS